jgi:hypothetical protein
LEIQEKKVWWIQESKIGALMNQCDCELRANFSEPIAGQTGSLSIVFLGMMTVALRKDLPGAMHKIKVILFAECFRNRLSNVPCESFSVDSLHRAWTISPRRYGKVSGISLKNFATVGLLADAGLKKFTQRGDFFVSGLSGPVFVGLYGTQDSGLHFLGFRRLFALVRFCRFLSGKLDS